MGKMRKGMGDEDDMVLYEMREMRSIESEEGSLPP